MTCTTRNNGRNKTMPDRLLYNLALPSDAQSSTAGQTQRNVSRQGALASEGVAESVSVDPGQFRLSGSFRGQYAELMAAEFEALFNSSAPGIEQVPYFGRDERTPADGYYTLDQATVQRVDPRDARLQEFDAQLTLAGTRRTHWRAVKVHPQPVSNPFGAATTEEVGISQRATKTRWWNQKSGAVEDATVQSSTVGEHDRVDLYDATEPSFANEDTYYLLYDLPFEHGWPVDCRVWDPHDRAKKEGITRGSPTVATTTTVGTDVFAGPASTVTWERVFVSRHDFDAEPIVENDHLRLQFDDPEQVLRAYEWDESEEHWTRTPLGDNAWRLFDANIREIGLEHVDVQAEFEDASAASLTTHNVNISVKRGRTAALITNPESAAVPAGLQTRLEPIAHDSDQDPSAVQTLADRSEVDI